jgi:hypothetical protein
MECGNFNPGKFMSLSLVVLFVFSGVCCAATKQKLTNARFAPQEAETRANIGAIQSGLIRYAKQFDGIYPSSASKIFDEDFMPSGYPQNPFTNAPVKEIRFGEEPFDGDFTYIPVLIDGRIRAYYLIGYGSKETDGKDVNADGQPDHVIEVLQGPGDETITSKMPPLEDLLKKSG